MSLSTPRARRADSLAAAIEELLDAYQTPLPTNAVRVLLADSGRPVTAEHLSRAAANEREVYERTRMPPLVCSAIAPDGELVRPRWWVDADWRLQRRILTDDAMALWFAGLADRLCLDFARRRRPVDGELRRLGLWAITRLGIENRFDLPLAPADWMAIREQVAEAHPGVTHSLDGATEQQRLAEARLREAGVPVDLYFGRPRSRR
jgi:hypothetical protein